MGSRCTVQPWVLFCQGTRGRILSRAGGPTSSLLIPLPLSQGPVGSKWPGIGRPTKPLNHGLLSPSLTCRRPDGAKPAQGSARAGNSSSPKSCPYTFTCDAQSLTGTSSWPTYFLFRDSYRESCLSVQNVFGDKRERWWMRVDGLNCWMGSRKREGTWFSEPILLLSLTVQEDGMLRERPKEH